MTGQGSENSAEILDMKAARERRQDFAAHTGFDTAGAYLREMRENSGFSLTDISERTHIREQHLRGIETGDLSLLPARAYVSGFVKTYAEVLGLDPAPLVARFREDVGLSTPVPVDPKGFETAEARADMEKRDMSLWAVIAVIAFILWCSWQVMEAKTRNDAAKSAAALVSASAATQNTASAPLVSGVPVAINTAPVIVAPAPQAVAIFDPLSDAPAANSDGIVVAHIIERVEPVYPRLCEGQSQPQETVETSFNITADGRVAGERVIAASNSCFERAAINALKRWRFAPQQIDGRAKASYDQVYTFVFKQPA